MLVFVEEGTLGAVTRTNKKLNPHMASTPGYEPAPHWWEASALTTAPFLLPATEHLKKSTTRAAIQPITSYHEYRIKHDESHNISENRDQ